MADAVSRTYEVNITLQNPPQGLQLGMTASVANTGEEQAAADTVVLPLSAIYQTGSAPQVWVVGKDKTLSLKNVSVETFGDNSVKVTGLHKGDISSRPASINYGPAKKSASRGKVYEKLIRSIPPQPGLSLVFHHLVAIAGVFSYIKLGRMEDPTYTVRTMIVTVAWPGATAEQMEEQVTDKIERNFRIRRTSITSRVIPAGQSVIYVNLDDKAPQSSIRDTWHEVRNLTEDVKRELPDGVYGLIMTTASTMSSALSMPHRRRLFL